MEKRRTAAILILDHAEPENLKAYGTMLDLLPSRKKICGFISGMCGHNMAHEKSPEILKGLYKSAVFPVQAVSYLQTGTYRKKKAELLPVLQQSEREILETAIALKQQPNLAQDEFDRISGQLFRWASRMIAEYRPKETGENRNA